MSDGIKKAKVHGTKGNPWEDEDGYWLIECFYEYEGKMETDNFIFNNEETVLEFQTYFKSPKGMEPIELIL